MPEHIDTTLLKEANYALRNMVGAYTSAGDPVYDYWLIPPCNRARHFISEAITALAYDEGSLPVQELLARACTALHLFMQTVDAHEAPYPKSLLDGHLDDVRQVLAAVDKALA